MLEGLDRKRLAGGIFLNLLLKLRKTGSAGAGSGLIGRGDKALKALRLMERSDGLKHDGGRAVRVRDNALVPVKVLGVHLRYDERNFRILTESAGVVDHFRAGLDDGVFKFDGDVRLTGEKNDIHSVEAVLVRLEDVIRLAENLLVALARRKNLNLAAREVALLEDSDHFGTDRADTDQTDIISFH